MENFEPLMLLAGPPTLKVPTGSAMSRPLGEGVVTAGGGVGKTGGVGIAGSGVPVAPGEGEPEAPGAGVPVAPGAGEALTCLTDVAVIDVANEPTPTTSTRSPTKGGGPVMTVDEFTNT
jgi:hypothetical protein